MAHIETRYCCPVCNGAYDTYGEATTCKNKHSVRSERWAVGKGGKAVRIFENCASDGIGGENYALREADLSDIISERKEQLEQEKFNLNYERKVDNN